jgi:hypothetical protein
VCGVQGQIFSSQSFLHASSRSVVYPKLLALEKFYKLVILSGSDRLLVDPGRRFEVARKAREVRFGTHRNPTAIYFPVSQIIVAQSKSMVSQGRFEAEEVFQNIASNVHVLPCKASLKVV